MNMQTITVMKPHTFLVSSASENEKLSFRNDQGMQWDVPVYTVNGESYVRCLPTTSGEWTLHRKGEECPLYCMTAEVDEASKWPGLLQKDPENLGHFLIGQKHYFMHGYECDWLWALGQESMEKLEAFLEHLTAYGFNCIHMNVFAYDTAWRKGKSCDDDYGPPKMIPWMGTNEKPDHQHLNEAFFASYDQVMDALYRHGFTVHLYMKVYNKAVVWPTKGSKEEELFFSHVIARYQAYPGVMWDFSKECYLEPDKACIASFYEMLAGMDGYHHLTTLHDEPQFYDEHPNMLDFFSAQQFYDFYYHVMYHREHLQMPILMAEYAYEYGAGGEEDKTYPKAHDPKEVVRRAWEIAMAGGYSTYYYSHTGWDVIDTQATPPGYTGMKVLHDVMTATKWWEMKRDERVCCWRNMRCLRLGHELYYVYVHGIKGQMMMQMGENADQYEGQWVDIFTGERLPATLRQEGTYLHANMPEHMPKGLLVLTLKDHIVSRNLHKQPPKRKGNERRR